MYVFLDVGSGSDESLPSYYRDWTRHRLDIDPACHPDVLLDARHLDRLAASSYDAVYCSHNLEHYYRHDGLKVVRGIHHVLKPTGFFEVRVPDVLSLMQAVVASKLDLDAVVYRSRGNDIRVNDMIYGWSDMIERCGNDFWAHKTGFSTTTLINFVAPVGFAHYVIGPANPFEIRIYFFKQAPEPHVERLIANQSIPAAGAAS
ncbi:MAG TPA: methyltransferase domain-containing protein [Tepidisphaeraceae bacterium]|jgi:SAM-dependent methyltransferase